MRQKVWLTISMLILMPLAGCGTRTVIVRQGDPMVVRKTIKNAPVWVYDKDGKLVESKADIPEGWDVIGRARK